MNKLICKVCGSQIKGRVFEHYKKKHLDIFNQFYGERMSELGKKGGVSGWTPERRKMQGEQARRASQARVDKLKEKK